MSPSRAETPIRLLLVEDDQESGDSLRLLLEKRGLNVTWLSRAEEAVSEWESGSFDAIVSDIRLGRMNGVDFLRHVREKNPDFPFLLLTGFDSLDTAIQAVKLGASDYILKPLDNIDDLLRPIAEAVRHYRLQLHAVAVEKKLKESERKLSTLLSNLAGMAYHCHNDRQWTMDFASDGCRELLGCEPDDLVGNRTYAYGDLIHPDDRERVWADVQSALAAGTFFRIEYRILTVDGREKWVWEQGRAADAACRRIEGFIEDITERRQAAEEIRRLNADLEQRVRARTADLEMANRELEAFSYSISHDLRTPLRVIEGFSRILLDRDENKLDGEAREDLARIRQAAQKMSDMIRAMLALSCLSQQEMSQAPVDLSRLVHELVADLRQSDPGRAADVVIAENAVATGDARLLRVALQNLLANAWKFTRHVAPVRIEFGRCEKAGRTAFFVRDNGAGFDMTYADKLFGAFQRMHSEKEFEGTGIGLATVKRVIQRHGGAVWAESAVGKGSTFYFAV